MSRYGENIRERADGRWEARVVQGRPVHRRTNYKYLYGRSYEDVSRKKIVFLLTLPPRTEGQERAGGAAPTPVRAEECIPPAPIHAEENALPKEPPSPVSSYYNKEDSPPEPRGPAVSEVAREWLQHKKASVKESTYAYYTVMVRNHVIPGLGEESVQVLTPEKISDFLMKRKKSGRIRDGKPLSDKTVSDLKTIVKQLLSYAEQRGLLTDVPACPAVPAKQPPISVLTKSEQEKLEAAARAENTSFSLGILLSLYGGPRIGEVCGLRWEDFDFENETVRISRTVSRIRDVETDSGPRTRLTIASPKTECSVRTIPLPSQIFAYLRERKGEGTQYVLTGTGKFLEPRLCRARFKRFLKRAGVEDHTFHTLRHTYATRCVENGVDFKSLSEMMGHSDVKITMQRYVHPSIDFKKEQVNKLPCFA